jgi:hypothetical protein
MSDPNIINDEPGASPKPDGSVIDANKPEELILGRFKSKDEVVTAYPEAEKLMTQATQEAADLRRQNQELQERINQQQVQPPKPDEVDYDELFWKKPTEVISKMIRQSIEPLTGNYYEQQKSVLRNDPEFIRLEPQIDQIANMYPDVKTKPEAVKQLFKMVKGLNFDEVEFEKRMREKIAIEQGRKIEGSIEGAGAGRDSFASTEKVELTEEEKKVALKWYEGQGITNPDEAYKKYAEAKKSYAGGR